MFYCFSYLLRDKTRSYASLHCAVITVADAAGTDESGNKLIPKSNTTDNMIKMITALLSFMISYSSFFWG